MHCQSGISRVAKPQSTFLCELNAVMRPKLLEGLDAVLDKMSSPDGTIVVRALEAKFAKLVRRVETRREARRAAATTSTSS